MLSKKEALERQVRKLGKEEEWNHFFELPLGVVTRKEHINSPGYNLNKWNRMKKFINAIPNRKNKTVLDVGCSDGYFSIQCSKEFRWVRGTDIDEKRIRKADFIRSELGVDCNTEFVVESLYDIREDYRYGLVLGLGLLHRVPDLDACVTKLAALGNAVLLEYKSLNTQEDKIEYAGGRTKSNEFNALHSIPSDSYIIRKMEELGFPFFMIEHDSSSLRYKRTMILFSREEV